MEKNNSNFMVFSNLGKHEKIKPNFGTRNRTLRDS